MFRGILTVFAFAFVLGIFPSSSHAERSGGVIRLEEITIEGRVQKPNAFYVLQRSSLGFEQANTDQSFVEDVIESVNNDPF